MFFIRIFYLGHLNPEKQVVLIKTLGIRFAVSEAVYLSFLGFRLHVLRKADSSIKKWFHVLVFVSFIVLGYHPFTVLMMLPKSNRLLTEFVVLFSC